ncbi:uncharacterized protein LOC135396699 [Ornithodoros turicata]|uniref:uncharacterized protein LOC135396699 n=1 Tax=Ornithodoros turicata TaxID=34597 RepID=UPI003138C73D
MHLHVLYAALLLLVAVQLTQADVLPAAAFGLSVGSKFLRRLADIKDKLRISLERTIQDFRRRQLALSYGHHPAFQQNPAVPSRFVSMPFPLQPWFQHSEPFGMSFHKTAVSPFGSAIVNMHQTFGQQPPVQSFGSVPAPLDFQVNDTEAQPPSPVTGWILRKPFFKQGSFEKFMSMPPYGPQLFAKWNVVALKGVGQTLSKHKDSLQAAVRTTTPGAVVTESEDTTVTSVPISTAGPTNNEVDARNLEFIMTSTTPQPTTETAPTTRTDDLEHVDDRLVLSPPHLWKGNEEPQVAYGMSSPLNVSLDDEDTPLVFNSVWRQGRTDTQ